MFFIDVYLIYSVGLIPAIQENVSVIHIYTFFFIFFAAKDGEALYSQQKQDWELTVARTMNSLLPNSDLN